MSTETVTLIKVTLSLEIQCSDVDVSNGIEVDPAVHGTRAVYPTDWIRKHITQARQLMTTLHLVPQTVCPHDLVLDDLGGYTCAAVNTRSRRKYMHAHGTSQVVACRDRRSQPHLRNNMRTLWCVPHGLINPNLKTTNC